MKISKKVILYAIALFAASGGIAEAAQVPTYVVAPVNNNTQVQITIMGADPNTAVTLYYPQSGSYGQLSIGTANASGLLSYTLNPTTYNITIGGTSYVMAGGARSQNQTWPSYSATSQAANSNSLALSPSSVSLNVGQNAYVNVSAANGSSLGSVTVPSNTNSAAASAQISGSQVTVSGNSVGITQMTVCASNVGCSLLNVTVTQNSSSNSGGTTVISQNISISPSTISLKVGESRVVTLSGLGSYYISAHTNRNTVNTSISGNNLTITGNSQGTNYISVCGTNSSGTSCGTLLVNIFASSTAGTSANDKVTFSQSDVEIAKGGNKEVTITGYGPGAGAYYISSNSNPNAVSANIVGSIVTLTGQDTGGTNISICQFGGECSNLYAFVPSGGVNNNVPVTSSKPLELALFGVASNNVGGSFFGKGAALTISWSANQGLSNQNMTVGGQVVPLLGNGSGPFSGIYTLTGTEKLPIEIGLSLSAAAGSIKQSFVIGAVSASQESSQSGSSASSVFVSYLRVGSTGSEVTALQTRLTALGFYSGPITGTFGGQTEAAVRKYQAKHKLDQLGVVGPATRALLNKGI